MVYQHSFHINPRHDGRDYEGHIFVRFPIYQDRVGEYRGGLAVIAKARIGLLPRLSISCHLLFMERRISQASTKWPPVMTKATGRGHCDLGASSAESLVSSLGVLATSLTTTFPLRGERRGERDLLFSSTFWYCFSFPHCIRSSISSFRTLHASYHGRGFCGNYNRYACWCRLAARSKPAISHLGTQRWHIPIGFCGAWR